MFEGQNCGFKVKICQNKKKFIVQGQNLSKIWFISQKFVNILDSWSNFVKILVFEGHNLSKFWLLRSKFGFN